MNTLLIIDMQNAWLNNPAQPCFDSAAIVGRINHAARQVRAQGGKVIFVQHSDADAPIGSAPWQVITALEKDPADSTLLKLAGDSFAATDLAAQLAASATSTLYISGFATEFCIDTAVRAAASRGLNVVALSDAHTTADRPHLDAPAIIAHHNWVWSGLPVPAGSSLAVRTTAEAFPA
ncbi:isochorismatase family protein [Massilia antarctica]|uniref:isochorismatase family protein n=1 Tax=Massilia antarctica TaxID=2765360 RepID=UPI0006BC84C9|nr:isochorismatase family protein [Massilia sp. H27-R4]MCY0913614.1 isochorismatase family protein [Massilia sp. H27-R4]CUI06016.1 Isochorismatase [Janthinobacterium sp. CG23_2]CUU29802.1 Isochorismatase [Janthinobacterium sp. CG23_2]